MKCCKGQEEVDKTEVGGEFWEVPVTGGKHKIWPASVQWYLSGRSALGAIIKELDGVKSVAMPSWCCESMVKPFVDAGINVSFYPVYFEDGRFIQKLCMEHDALFLMEYFGYAAGAEECIRAGYKGVVIRDVTHSIFSKGYFDSEYCFGSLRKWCGVWTGGYAWAGDGHPLSMEDNNDVWYVPLRREAMQLKKGYINAGAYGSKGNIDKKYLDVFAEAENILDGCGIIPAAKRDIELAEKLDINLLRAQRKSNAKILMDAFPDMLLFKQIKEGDCPLFVPILVPDGIRDRLRRYLVEKNIYCPVHWPLSRSHKIGRREKQIYQQELSLVCDQRYQKEDMWRIVDTINDFWREYK